jgi:hypothetical protein
MIRADIRVNICYLRKIVYFLYNFEDNSFASKLFEIWNSSK